MNLINDGENQVIDNFTGQYGFLSNFYHSPFYVEKRYQACKTLNELEKSRILTAPDPGTAKKIGQTVTLREDWEFIKIPVMIDLLCVKFSLHSVLADLLLDTGKARLVEGNTWGDIFWGVCEGVGENMLGKLLMERRTKLQELLGVV